MRGLMMDVQLTVPSLLDRAAALFADQEIVSRRPDRSIHRYSVGEFVDRARRLAVALQDLGVTPGTRVGTLAWNHFQHLEAYLAIPSAGAILHTLNLRLHPDDLAYIINHAEDRVILVDEVLLPLLAKVQDRIDTDRIIVMSQGGPSAAALEHGLLDYETLLAAADPDRYTAVELDENDAAAMCYTSGTTGMPKGVLYSHRSIFLHAMALALPDSVALSENTVSLLVTPMFHVNAWGAPFASVLTGGKQVFPGPHLDAASLCALFESESVTMTAGVPTIWLAILDHLDEDPDRYDLSALETMLVGGSAAPPAMMRAFDERHGLRVVHAWGMTETSPLGTISRLRPAHLQAPYDRQLEVRARQGRMAPMVELRARNEEGIVPWDGATLGELEIRGPWVAKAYFNSDQGNDNFTDDGWFRTGDIVNIDPEGYITIEDRSKDLIKTGGEWISSIALENALMGHPQIAEAAVIPVAHPKWVERPLAVIVPVGEEVPGLEEVREFLAPHFASWWLPDAVEVVEQIPRTTTGKFRKATLREQFADYRLDD